MSPERLLKRMKMPRVPMMSMNLLPCGPMVPSISPRAISTSISTKFLNVIFSGGITSSAVLLN